MFLLQNIFQMLFLDRIITQSQNYTGEDFLLHSLSTSNSNTSCKSEELYSCRDDSAAFPLKFVAMGSILFAGVVGIAIPLVGKHRKFLKTDSNLFVATKAFAAGVILATGFVHMLSGGSNALSNPCLPAYPWAKFPFAGFFAMMASLMTLLVDFVGTQYYERKQGLSRSSEEQGRVGSVSEGSESGIVPAAEEKDCSGKIFGEEEGGGMHILGMRAHAAHHRQNHSHGQETRDGNSRQQQHPHEHTHEHGNSDDDDDNNVRQVVVSQVLELGIVSHSVIIGLSLGVSQSPCTIRPLIAALSFHQFFEGFALGGCISQAHFRTLSTVLMSSFFALTTPAGIGLGHAISSSYNADSPGALITEGVLDCISAGILVYMSLVDLIAADFLSKTMSCNLRLQVVSYVMLFLGAGLMSLLAIWA